MSTIDIIVAVQSSDGRVRLAIARGVALIATDVSDTGSFEAHSFLDLELTTDKWVFAFPARGVKR